MTHILVNLQCILGRSLITGDADGNICMWGSMSKMRRPDSTNRTKDKSRMGGITEVSSRHIPWVATSYGSPIADVTAGDGLYPTLATWKLCIAMHKRSGYDEKQKRET